jgi:lantibiotic modifying enzyme
MTKENEINSTDFVLQEIFQRVESRTGNSELGLMGGIAGELLFLNEYHGYTKEDRVLNLIHIRLTSLLESIYNGSFQLLSFSNGLTGVLWLFKLMEEKGLVEGKILPMPLKLKLESLVLENIDEIFKKEGYDYLHGGLGLRLGLTDFDMLAQFDERAIALLKRNYIKTDQDYFAFECYPELFRGLPVIDMGLAHGNGSIIFFLHQITKTQGNDSLTKNLLVNLIQFYLTFPERDRKNLHGFWPSFYNKEYLTKDSRLAWCYGDLGICAMLSNLIGEDSYIKNKIDLLEIASKCVNRKELHETLITDSSLCHGTSGVAYLMHKLFINSCHQEFEGARNFWIDRTIDVVKQQLVKPTLYQDLTFLTGLSGVGTVLCAMKGNQSKWDECILLS